MTISFRYSTYSHIIAAGMLLMHLTSSAQDETLIFNSINRSNGLPNNTINDITEDALGFIWFATNNGLVRYDSPSQMKIFKKGDVGLLSNNIKTIHAGDDSTLWVGTDFGGLTLLNVNTLEYRNYNTHQPEPNKIAHDVVKAILVDSKGNKWIGTEDGLNIISPDLTQNITVNNSDSFITDSAILSIIEDDKGWIWIGTWENGIFLYIPNRESLNSSIPFKRLRPSKINASSNICKILQTEPNEYWVGTHAGGLFHMAIPDEIDRSSQDDWKPVFTNYSTNSFPSDNICANIINDLEKDNQGNIWIATVDGINILRDFDSTKSLANVRFETYTSIPFNETSLIGNIFSKLYFDKNNIMWIGASKGVSQYHQYSNQFDFISIINKESSSKNLVNNIKKINKNEVLLATESEGALIYDFNKGTIDKRKTDFLPKSIKTMYQLCHDTGSKYYIAVKNGILHVDIDLRSYEFYKLPESSIQKFGVFRIKNVFKDNENKIWCSSEYGLYIIDDTHKEKMLKPHMSNQLTDISVINTFQDSRNNIWVTTYNGLNKIVKDGDGYQITKYKRESEEDKCTVPQNKLMAVDEYNNHLYFGGRNGIFSLNLDTEVFDNLNFQTDRHNIADISITSDGVLWASTSDGILKCDLNKSEVNFFEENEGIGALTMQRNNLYIDPDQKIYFGGTNGFLKIDPETIIENDTPPEVYITDISIINSSNSESTNGLNLKELVIDPDNYSLSIEFAGLNYYQIDKNLFKYKLEGFDEQWITTKPGQKAVYTNLKHGDYTFNVTAANNKGVWNEQPAQLEIKVKSYIWERLWFKILSLAVIAFLVWTLFKIYTKRIKSRNKTLSDFNESLNMEIAEKKEAEAALLDREKSMKELYKKLDDVNKDLVRSNKDLEQFAFIVSHDMKEPLRTIGSFTTLLQKNYSLNFDDKAKKYMGFITNGVERLSALINGILKYSIAGNKKMDFKVIDLNKIVTDKIQGLNQFIIDKNAKIIFENKLPSISCIGDQIGMVFYNTILNGIKFNKSENPTIHINAIEKDNHWEFSVTDNGIGIPEEYQKQVFELFKRLHRKEEYEGTGIGLALTSRIINNHQGELWIESAPEIGTTIFFTLPYSQ